MIEITTSFVISGEELSFAEMTDIVGLTPSETRRKEEYYVPQFAKDTWDYCLTDVYPVPEWGDKGIPYPDVMTQLGEIQSLLEDRVDAIREYCAPRKLEVVFVVASSSEDDRQPLMDLPADFISFMARLGARISFDLYVNVTTL